MTISEVEHAKVSLSWALIELIWHADRASQTFNVECKGFDWEVVVRKRPTYSGDPPVSSSDLSVSKRNLPVSKNEQCDICSLEDEDFTEQLPE